jgi:hypothetical protein
MRARFRPSLTLRSFNRLVATPDSARWHLTPDGEAQNAGHCLPTDERCQRMEEEPCGSVLNLVWFRWDTGN